MKSCSVEESGGNNIFFLKSKYFPVSNVWHQEKVDISDLNNYSSVKIPGEKKDTFNIKMDIIFSLLHKASVHLKKKKKKKKLAVTY